MKKIFSVFIILCIALAFTTTAQARNTKYLLPIADAMQSETSEAKLGNLVKFYFAGQSHPLVIKKYGTYVVNPKTNAVGKKDIPACNWVFLSALRGLQKHARQLNANAVINIVSYYKKNEMASPSQFECHAGATVAGVALKGEIVKIANK